MKSRPGIISRPGARPTNGISIKFDQNLKCSSLKYAQPITGHDSYTVTWHVQSVIVIDRVHFKLEHYKFWLNFKFNQNMVSGPVWSHGTKYWHVLAMAQGFIALEILLWTVTMVPRFCLVICVVCRDLVWEWHMVPWRPAILAHYLGCTHNTKDCTTATLSHRIQIWWKFRFVFIWIVMKWLLHNFYCCHSMYKIL